MIIETPEEFKGNKEIEYWYHLCNEIVIKNIEENL